MVPLSKEITDKPNQIHMSPEYEIISFSIMVFHASGKKEPAPERPFVIPMSNPVFSG